MKLSMGWLLIIRAIHIGQKSFCSYEFSKNSVSVVFADSTAETIAFMQNFELLRSAMHNRYTIKETLADTNVSFRKIRSHIRLVDVLQKVFHFSTSS